MAPVIDDKHDLRSAGTRIVAHRVSHREARSLFAEGHHRRKAEVERLVAPRFPKPDIATAVWPFADAITVVSRTAQVVANMA